MDWTSLIQTGAAGLVVVVVVYAFRELRSMRDGFLNTINNHIHENTAVLQELKSMVAKLTGYLERNGRS